MLQPHLHQQLQFKKNLLEHFCQYAVHLFMKKTTNNNHKTTKTHEKSILLSTSNLASPQHIQTNSCTTDM